MKEKKFKKSTFGKICFKDFVFETRTLKQILPNVDFLNFFSFIILKMQSIIKKIVFILKFSII